MVVPIQLRIHFDFLKEALLNLILRIELVNQVGLVEYAGHSLSVFPAVDVDVRVVRVRRVGNGHHHAVAARGCDVAGEEVEFGPPQKVCNKEANKVGRRVSFWILNHAPNGGSPDSIAVLQDIPSDSIGVGGRRKIRSYLVKGPCYYLKRPEEEDDIKRVLRGITPPKGHVEWSVK